ncbi:hypothetical protein Ddc_11080 [Ditylenchus destructor]|nr:hypothetical protein Ddc_11080 [Ditylenchus destructor]
MLREIPLDVEKVYNCQYVTCVLLKYHILVPMYAKFGMGGLNVLGSCYLIFAMKWNNEKLKNDVIKFTTTVDIFFDVLPIFANFIFVSIFGFFPSVYIGQLVAILAFLNVAVCSIYYSWRLTRKMNWIWTKVNRVEQVSPATTAI